MHSQKHPQSACPHWLQTCWDTKPGNRLNKALPSGIHLCVTSCPLEFNKASTKTLRAHLLVKPHLHKHGSENAIVGMRRSHWYTPDLKKMWMTKMKKLNTMKLAAKNVKQT
jgi:hypothetical protein